MALPRARDENTEAFVPGWAWNMVVDVVTRILNISVESPLTLLSSPTGIRIGFTPPAPDGHWAKITGNFQQVDEGDGDDLELWAYDSQQVRKETAGPKGWVVVTGGIVTSSTTDSEDPAAWNTLEDMNGKVGAGETGSGTNTSELPDSDPPDEDNPALYLKPVPNGAIVWMRRVSTGDGKTEYHFTAPNGIGGPCPTSEEE